MNSENMECGTDLRTLLEKWYTSMQKPHNPVPGSQECIPHERTYVAFTGLKRVFPQNCARCALTCCSYHFPAFFWKYFPSIKDSADLPCEFRFLDPPQLFHTPGTANKVSQRVQI
jgi:hypothetical protein